MRKLLIALLVSSVAVLHAGTVRADRLSGLIKRLEQDPSFKVRLGAVTRLSKYADRRADNALMEALKRGREDPRVRGAAAWALGQKMAYRAVPTLRMASRYDNDFVKSKARAALERLCPSKLEGKRFYIDLDRIKARGPLSRVSQGIAKLHLSEVLAKRADVVTGWPNCKKPKARHLLDRYMLGFSLETRVHISEKAKAVKCKVSVMFTSYPGQVIKADATIRMTASGKATVEVINTLVETAVGAFKDDIHKFLDSQKALLP